MRSMMRMLVLVGMLLAFGVAPAQAQQTLDQQQPTTTGLAYGVPPQPSGLAQTFTAGLTGTLTQVDVFISNNQYTLTPLPPLIVEIRDTVGGVPGNTVLATATVQPAAVTAAGYFVSVTLAPGAPVVAGMQYAIVLSQTATTPALDPNRAGFYAWAILQGGDPYPAGEPYALSSPRTRLGALDDFAFRTYVTVAAYAAAFSVEGLAVSGRTLSFRIIGPGKVRFTLDRRIAPKRYRRVGSFVRQARRGRNRVRIPSRLTGRRVRKGVYRLSARSFGGGLPSGPLERRIVRLR